MDSYGDAKINVGVATKTPEFEILRTELDKAVEALYYEIEGLEARLETVLLPNAPIPNNLNEKSVEPHSQSVIHLRMILSKIGDAHRRIGNIKQRLEV